MSTISEQIAAREAAAKKKKSKAKRDEHGRFVKAEDTADLTTPSF